MVLKCWPKVTARAAHRGAVENLVMNNWTPMMPQCFVWLLVGEIIMEGILAINITLHVGFSIAHVHTLRMRKKLVKPV